MGDLLRITVTAQNLLKFPIRDPVADIFPSSIPLVDFQFPTWMGIMWDSANLTIPSRHHHGD